jgi:sirohydrochlorin ferrochelatase
MSAVAGTASADIMVDHQSRTQIGAKRIASFRRRWANKSDTAIKAALNHFWRKQIDRGAAATRKESKLRK